MAHRFVLPSGVRVRLDGTAGPAASLAEELDGASVELSDGQGRPLELDALPLSDFHSLRAVARRLGVVAEATQTIRCGNCDGEHDVLPCSRLEIGPYADDELDDPELDAAFDFDVPHEGVRLAARSVGEARAVLSAVGPGRGLRFTSAVVRGLGIEELSGETSPARIARKLTHLGDDAFDALAALWEDAHYPPRLVAPHPCPECGVVEWLAVPAERELSIGATSPPAGELADFPTPDELEALVRDVAPEIYAELEIDEVGLVVMDGPAECDDAGEPLLGCYLPPEPDALLPHGPEIRLYYRSFREMWREEGPYDLRAEVSETIAHELTHHLGFLGGDDPLDDEERAAIDEELGRRVGRKEARRRAARELGGGVVGFLRRTWWLWLIVGAVTVLASVAGK